MTRPASPALLDQIRRELDQAERINRSRLAGRPVDRDELDARLSDVAELARTARYVIAEEDLAARVAADPAGGAA